VLIIDDDVQLCSMLQEYLGSHGWEVRAAHTANEGMRLASAEAPSLVILDVMLPDLDGFDVLRRLHQQKPYKVLMLTARGQQIDRIVGLEMGADDYLGKPFNPRELMARMKAVLRRARQVEPEESSISSRDFQIDIRSRQISFRQQRISLSDIEFALLQRFLQSPHQVLNRDELSQALFDRPARPFDRSLDMHVSRLRKKLDALRDFRGELRAIRNEGYLFIEERED